VSPIRVLNHSFSKADRVFRRRPSKKAAASLAKKVEFFEYQQTLRNEMSALEAKEAAAKEYGINTRKADDWNSAARDFLKRLKQDGKNFENN
jgi:fructose-1,6-bisphosphatase